MPRKSTVETELVDPNEFRRVTRSQSKSPTKSTPKAARKTEIDREETRIIGSPTDVDAFAEVITMPNSTGDATSEAEINHAFNELNNFLDEEGMNSVDLPLGRGPLASKASATSTVSSSSLTALKTQGYSTVPIKDIGINPLKSTSYYVVDLTNASLETLEIMDRDADVVICIEDEAWMQKASIEWLFNEGIQGKYNFRGTQTSWVKDKARINSSYGLYDSYLFESSNECEI